MAQAKKPIITKLTPAPVTPAVAPAPVAPVVTPVAPAVAPVAPVDAPLSVAGARAMEAFLVTITESNVLDERSTEVIKDAFKQHIAPSFKDKVATGTTKGPNSWQKFLKSFKGQKMSSKDIGALWSAKTVPEKAAWVKAYDAGLPTTTATTTTTATAEPKETGGWQKFLRFHKGKNMSSTQISALWKEIGSTPTGKAEWVKTH